VGIFEWMKLGFDAAEELVIGGAEQMGDTRHVLNTK